MHRWGDGWEHWGDMSDLVDFMARSLWTGSSVEVTDVKEKYGTLRVYCYRPSTPKQVHEYRGANQAALLKYPHLRAEILVDADWPDLLTGLVPENECDHPSNCRWTLTSSDGQDIIRCGICGKVFLTARASGI